MSLYDDDPREEEASPEEENSDQQENAGEGGNDGDASGGQNIRTGQGNGNRFDPFRKDDAVTSGKNKANTPDTGGIPEKDSSKNVGAQSGTKTAEGAQQAGQGGKRVAEGAQQTAEKGKQVANTAKKTKAAADAAETAVVAGTAVESAGTTLAAELAKKEAERVIEAQLKNPTDPTAGAKQIAKDTTSIIKWSLIITLFLVFLILVPFITLIILFASEDEKDKDTAGELKITKTGPEAVANGQNITYTITVSYPAVADDIVVQDRIPTGTTFVNSTSKLSCDNITCNAKSKTIRWSSKDNNITPPLQTSFTLVLKPTIKDSYILNLATGSVTGGSSGSGGGGTIGTPGPKPPNYPTDLRQAIINTFGITMNGFAKPQLTWAWERFWEISNTKYTSLVAGAVIVANNADYSSQIGCPPGTTLLLRPYATEKTFKFMLTHELGHQIRNCNKRAVIRYNEHLNAYDKEGAVSYYGANAYACWKTNNYSEDYADAIAYGVTSDVNGGVSSCGPSWPHPFYPAPAKKPLHYNNVILPVLGK